MAKYVVEWSISSSILDDTRDMAHLADRLVLTDPRVGLSDANVAHAIKLMDGSLKWSPYA
jgi:hypothetical protein